MRQWAWISALVLTSLTTAGCVERRFVVTTDPPGALVLRNGAPIGAAPADDHFIYYGDYDFTIIKDGYETLEVKQDVPAPWYEYPPLDFFAEALVPWRIKDVRRYHYQLQPTRAVSPDELLQKANVVRERGKTIQPPPKPPAPSRNIQQQPLPPQPGPGQMPFISGFPSSRPGA